jgi:DNA-binding TFAR19-related protein (PDSD5 family)
MFGPPQPAASTNALSAVESSSTSEPSAAAQNVASARASAASNETALITLAMTGTIARTMDEHVVIVSIYGNMHVRRRQARQLARAITG